MAADLPQRHLELVAAVAAQRAHHVAGQALRVEPRGHVLGAHHVAVHHRDVLLAGRGLFQNATIWNRPNRLGRFATAATRDADVVRAEDRAVVVLVALDQLLERVDLWKPAAGLCHAATIPRPPAPAGAATGV